jgi:hypothetical protein
VFWRPTEVYIKITAYLIPEFMHKQAKYQYYCVPEKHSCRRESGRMQEFCAIELPWQVSGQQCYREWHIIHWNWHRKRAALESFELRQGTIILSVTDMRENYIKVEIIPKAPHYKPEGRGFDSRLCQWKFSFTSSFRPHNGPGVDSVSKRNEQHPLGGKGGRCVGLTALSSSRVDCNDIW